MAWQTHHIHILVMGVAGKSGDRAEGEGGGGYMGAGGGSLCFLQG